MILSNRLASKRVTWFGDWDLYVIFSDLWDKLVYQVMTDETLCGVCSGRRQPCQDV